MRRRTQAGHETRTDDTFREQHQLRSIGEREIDGARRPVVVNDAESPLGWLNSRKDRSGRPLITEHNTWPASACARIIGSRISVRG
jgi:hypothetical protein